MRMRNQAPQLPDPPEAWRDIPGYGGKYQASTEGRIRRVYADGSKLVLKQYERNGTNGKQHTVNLYDLDGKQRPSTVLRLVALTWMPEQARTGAVVHRNGLHSDNSVRNIAILTPRELGMRFGGVRRKAVCMLSRDGSVLEIFRSVTAASLATGLARETIVRHCKRLGTRPLPDGISFIWDRG